MLGIMSAIRVAGQTGERDDDPAPSHYVANVFAPLTALLGSPALDGNPRLRGLWADRVCTDVFDKCTEICTDLVVTAFQTDDVLNKVSSGSAGAESDNTKRFLRQLSVDINELGRTASSLGVAVDSLPSYQRLLRCLRIM